MQTIVLDPGHGGHARVGHSTPQGARTPDGQWEKDLTLALARRVAAQVPERVLLTRSDDRNVSLGARIDVANRSGATSFVSIHAGERGEEPANIWVHDRASPASIRLARALATAPSVPVRRAPLAVLSPEHLRTDVAACMIELNLRSDAGLRSAFEDGLARALEHASRTYGAAPTGSIRVASWNIEKSGQASLLNKRAKVDEFIHGCATSGYDIIFLCEVHSARVDDYIHHLQAVYGSQYLVIDQFGGHSNNYIALCRKGMPLENFGHANLEGLNRSLLYFYSPQTPAGHRFYLGLGHFKSGQTRLTQAQLNKTTESLQAVSGGAWAVMGDLNWSINNAHAIHPPAGSHWATATGVTHRAGDCLDWCIAGSRAALTAIDLTQSFPAQMFDMAGPDHRPIAFKIEW